MSQNTDRNPSALLIGRLSGVLASLIVLAGCQTYQSQTMGISQATKAGNLAAAVAQIDQQAKSNTGSKDELIYRLEQGAILRQAGLAEPSMVPDFRPPVAAPKMG